MPDYGLGRLYAPDQRDVRFLMSANIPEEMPIRERRYWIDGLWFGDQGDSSQCVEYSWHHWVQAWPTKPKGSGPYWDLGSVYEEAKTVDEWDGENYDGTSIRAGAKVLRRLGYIESYLWAWDIHNIIDAVLTIGPVVMGTTWYRDMFFPDSRGTITPTGRLEGGHAYLITGVNTKTGFFRIKNSWGKGWGRSGRARISIEDMDRLLLEDGEACLAVEKLNV